jgi:hypothetical protein
MKLVATRDAFDGEDVGTIMADGERETGIDTLAVGENGTGAALAAVAAFLGSGEMEALTQEIEQRDAGIVENEVAPCTVHGEADGVVHKWLRSDMDMAHRSARHRRGRRRYRTGADMARPTPAKIRRHPPFNKSHPKIFGIGQNPVRRQRDAALQGFSMGSI